MRFLPSVKSDKDTYVNGVTITELICYELSAHKHNIIVKGEDLG